MHKKGTPKMRSAETPLGWGVADHLKQAPPHILPISVTTSNLVVLRQRVYYRNPQSRPIYVGSDDPEHLERRVAMDPIFHLRQYFHTPRPRTTKFGMVTRVGRMLIGGQPRPLPREAEPRRLQHFWDLQRTPTRDDSNQILRGD